MGIESPIERRGVLLFRITETIQSDAFFTHDLTHLKKNSSDFKKMCSRVMCFVKEFAFHTSKHTQTRNTKLPAFLFLGLSQLSISIQIKKGCVFSNIHCNFSQKRTDFFLETFAYLLR
jgi:hypothetical protein